MEKLALGERPGRLRETENVPLAVRPDGIENRLFIDVPEWYRESVVSYRLSVVGSTDN